MNKHQIAGALAHPARVLRALGAMVLFSANVHATTTVTTTTSFDYEPTTGRLIKSMVEPGDSNLCQVTVFTLDPVYGNQTGAKVRNCNGSAPQTTGAMTEAAAPTGLAVFTARETTATYTANQRFIETTKNGLGQVETKAYDERFGGIKSVEDPNQVSVAWAYDNLGRKTLETRPDGTKTKWTYVYCNNVVVDGSALAVPAGAASAACDTVRADDLMQGLEGDLLVPSYYVQATPLQTDGTTANGAYTRSYFDTVGRVVRVETQGFDGVSGSKLVYVDTRYDRQGRVAAQSRPYYKGDTADWTTFLYDAFGRLTKRAETTAAGTSTTTMTYAGLVTTIKDPRSYDTKREMNVAGQVAKITDAKTGTIQRVYDPLGNLVQNTDAVGNVISIVFDKLGRKTALYDPDMGKWSYSYNALSELVKQTDAKSQSISIGYDVLGRVTSRTEPDLISNWYYDTYADGSTCSKGLGRLCETKTDNGYARKTAYDSVGRPLSITSTINSTNYVASVAYAAATGRLATQTYPTGVKVQFNYSTLGYMSSLTDTRNNTTLWTANSVDAQGALLQFTHGNGVVTNETFYADGRLHTLKAGTSNGIQNLTYGYDLSGNVKTRLDTATGVSASYDYDELNRLTTETRSGGGLTGNAVMSWGYDAIGNMTRRTEDGVDSIYNYNTSGKGSTRPHAVGSVSGFVNGFAGPDYDYDANGNLMSGAGRTLTWTSANMVSSVTKGNAQINYVYDADHERAKETYYLNGALQRTSVYLNAPGGAGLFYEEEAGVAGTRKKHYVSAGGATVAVIVCTVSPCTTVANSTTQYWHQDHLGSVSVVTNETGAVVERLAYEPFGKRRNANGTTDPYGNLTPKTDRGYTEHEHMDEVDLINMNGRIFDPALGRFMSADPGIPYPGSTQSYNRYSYARNNPLRAIDPTGFVDEHDCSGEDGCPHRDDGDKDSGGGKSDGSGGEGSSTQSGDQSGAGTGTSGDPTSTVTITASRSFPTSAGWVFSGTRFSAANGTTNYYDRGPAEDGTQQIGISASKIPSGGPSFGGGIVGVGVRGGHVPYTLGDVFRDHAASRAAGKFKGRPYIGDVLTDSPISALLRHAGLGAGQADAAAFAVGMLSPSGPVSTTKGFVSLGARMFSSNAGRSGAIAEDVLKRGTTLIFENFTIASKADGRDLGDAVKQLLDFAAEQGAKTLQFKGEFYDAALAAKFKLDVGDAFDFTVDATRAGLLKFLKGF